MTLEQEYKEWLDLTSIHKDPLYYHKLLKYATFIVEDLKVYRQHFMARKLNMTGPKFSIIKKVLEAQANILGEHHARTDT